MKHIGLFNWSHGRQISQHPAYKFVCSEQINSNRLAFIFQGTNELHGSRMVLSGAQPTISPAITELRAQLILQASRHSRANFASDTLTLVPSNLSHLQTRSIGETSKFFSTLRILHHNPLHVGSCCMSNCPYPSFFRVQYLNILKTKLQPSIIQSINTLSNNFNPNIKQKHCLSTLDFEPDLFFSPPKAAGETSFLPCPIPLPTPIPFQVLTILVFRPRSLCALRSCPG